ncbi:sigma-70 family RNA polymerase sigma factor [Streptomyces sp. NPDC057927]
MNIDETQLGDALDGDADAITGILREFDGVIRTRARRVDLHRAEDLEQVGREALWRCLSRFAGTTVGEFVSYADRTVTGAMHDAHCAMRYPGISKDEARLWRSAYKHADGDPEEAERLMCSGELAWRMRPETAKAVRAAASPTVALPEGLSCPPPAAGSEGGAGRFRGHAGMLLRCMGEQQRAVLEMTFGIGDTGRMSDSEIGAALGIPKERVPSTRSKALKRLREDWGRSFFFN